MKQTDWPQPDWSHKQSRARYEPLTVKEEPAFNAALREYAELETSRLGRTVSQGLILSTLSLRADAKLRRLVEKHRVRLTQ